MYLIVVTHASQRGVGERMDQGVLRWVGHVERMGEERLVRRVYESDVRRARCRGRQRARWLDEVKRALRGRGLGIQEVKECVQDRSEWHSVCQGLMCCWWASGVAL